MNKFIKRLIDFCIAFTGILVLLPFWIIISLLIKMSSKGPVLFIQKRPGLNAKVFSVYKFRTMKIGSEKMVKGVEVLINDHRITYIGKLLRRTKLDETPQLFNVLKGEMSLVGPRPERIESLKDYDEVIYQRLRVLPGLTGLAQVSGNIYIDLEQRYAYDVYYANNFSLLLDMKIIIRTVLVIIFGEKKYVDKPLVNTGDSSD